MKMILPLALAAALLAGCAAIEKAEHKSTEQMLAAGGFKVLPVDTPQRQAAFAQLKPYKISRQMRGSSVYYVYPDANGNFVYVGDQAAYSAYQKLLVQQQISDQNMMAAEMMDMPGPGVWPGWGYWGY